MCTHLVLEWRHMYKSLYVFEDFRWRVMLFSYSCMRSTFITVTQSVRVFETLIVKTPV